ncbi:hypothetical protein [Nocardiopsis sp. YSL2]|uniref:hypothetical protein n=1 Tax=Nocardiopsis sp. YSL2 TaxID=2939492 RepID=UPI0026F42F0A|nr:hypothetical protein [Nocardiopsis sp. YSL2]
MTERHDAVCIDLQRGAWPVDIVEEVIYQASDVVLKAWVNSFGVWVPVSLVRRDPWTYLGHLREVRVTDAHVPEALRDPRYTYGQPPAFSLIRTTSAARGGRA